MSLLEAPQTWIALAVALVLIAVVLFVLARRPRRRDARRPELGAGSHALRPADDETPTTDDTTTGPVLEPRPADGPRYVAMPRPAGPRPRPAVPVDEAGTSGEYTAPSGDAAADGDLVRADPARAGERAKDRLLAVLLSDPHGAVDVVTAMGDGAPASGTAAASLLRAGLAPDQVAGLCGVNESDLAQLIARDLGLIEPGPSEAQRRVDLPWRIGAGTNRTEVPGRAWASAGSASGSTTPTTG